MFQITEMFTDEEVGFSITPIHMENSGFVFLTQELESQLGYDDLPNMIKISDSFLEGIEYLILRNGTLRDFKGILKAASQKISSLSGIYQNIKFAPSLIVLTESGLYTVMLLSRKPNKQQFRRWVTTEVLPTIRRTGSYTLDRPQEAPLPPARSRDVDVLQMVSDQARLISALADQMYRNRSRIENLERDMAKMKDRVLLDRAVSNSEGHISPDQVAELRKRVKQKNKSKKDTTRLWGVFKKHFGLQRYRHLPASRFDEALKWLANYK